MARRKKLSLDEQIEMARMELERLEALKANAGIKAQIIELVNNCDDRAKLNKALKLLTPQEPAPQPEPEQNEQPEPEQIEMK